MGGAQSSLGSSMQTCPGLYGHWELAIPPQNGPSSVTQIPEQSVAISQPGFRGSLTQVVPSGQEGRPRLPQIAAVALGITVDIMLSSTQMPGQSAAISQPGLLGSLIQTVPPGQGGRPRLPHIAAVGVGVTLIVLLFGLGHIYSGL